MVDHHVDRPGVEVRQRMQLTGTNHSIGLIALINNAHRSRDARSMKSQLLHLSALCRPGGHGEEPEPDPIPNSAVKLLRANGTVSQDPGE